MATPRLVPALAPPPRTETRRTERPVPLRPLPAPPLHRPRHRSTVYGFGAVDNRGRVGDLMIVRAMGWAPGAPVTIQLVSGLVLITADSDGPHHLTGQGYLRLPAPVRHACAIRSGDRVFLAGEPGDGVITLHPLAALDDMVSTFRSHAIREGAS